MPYQYGHVYVLVSFMYVLSTLTVVHQSDEPMKARCVCFFFLGGGGLYYQYITRLHAHGAMRRFSLNFDRMLERAIRHSPLHKKVSYIVPDKIHELYQVNVCEYASLVY